MYKKITLFITLFCVWTEHISATKPWLEFKPSYFFFSSSPMHEIYNHGGFELQESVSIPLCHYIDLYGSAGYRQASGNALNTGEQTILSVIPIDIGLKPIFHLSERLNYFFTVGPRFFYFHQNNSSPYINHMINGGGVGFFINTGVNVLLANRMLIGIFGEYSYEKKTTSTNMFNVFNNRNVQIGGFAFGLSVGCQFS